MNTIENCRLINLPKVTDSRGALTFIENQKHIPFSMKRVYFLYDVASGESRAGHSHRELQQVLIATSGSFNVTVDDGKNKKIYTLNRPYQGLYIPCTIWRELDNFSSGSVCLSLASEPYDESDYYRNYQDFLVSRGIS